MKLRRYDIGDENHADSADLEVLADPVPELVGIDVRAHDLSQIVQWVPAILRALLRVQPAQMLGRPVTHAVGRVVEHLADHLPPDASVRRPLDLDDRGYGVVVNEEVVDAEVV